MHLVKDSSLDSYKNDDGEADDGDDEPMITLFRRLYNTLYLDYTAIQVGLPRLRCSQYPSSDTKKTNSRFWSCE